MKTYLKINKSLGFSQVVLSVFAFEQAMCSCFLVCLAIFIEKWAFENRSLCQLVCRLALNGAVFTNIWAHSEPREQPEVHLAVRRVHVLSPSSYGSPACFACSLDVSQGKDQEGGAGQDAVQSETSQKRMRQRMCFLCAFQASGSQDWTQRYGQIKIQIFNSILIKIIKSCFKLRSL